MSSGYVQLVHGGERGRRSDSSRSDQRWTEARLGFRVHWTGESEPRAPELKLKENCLQGSKIPSVEDISRTQLFVWGAWRAKKKHLLHHAFEFYVNEIMKASSLNCTTA